MEGLWCHSDLPLLGLPADFVTCLLDSGGLRFSCLNVFTSVSASRALVFERVLHAHTFN